MLHRRPLRPQGMGSAAEPAKRDGAGVVAVRMIPGDGALREQRQRTRDRLVRIGQRRDLRVLDAGPQPVGDRKSTRLNSSHVKISYAVFCLKKKKVTKR